MTTFYAAPDGEQEPCLWVRSGPEPDSAQDFYPLLRRCDLNARDQHLWPELVARLTGRAMADLRHQIQERRDVVHALEPGGPGGGRIGDPAFAQCQAFSLVLGLIDGQKPPTPQDADLPGSLPWTVARVQEVAE